jgi:hypothetical protein
MLGTSTTAVQRFNAQEAIVKQRCYNYGWAEVLEVTVGKL